MGSRHRKDVQHRYSSEIKLQWYHLTSVRQIIIKKTAHRKCPLMSVTETVFLTTLGNSNYSV